MQEPPPVLSWPSADDPLEPGRRVRLIDDLLGAILLLAALAFAALLELTRRRVCAVHQLAFLLCAGCAVFLVGGLADHHLSDDQLQLALHGGSLLSSPLATTYVYVPLGASAAAAALGLARLSVCSCDCCCLQGARCASHGACFPARLRANRALFAATFVLLWGLLGVRLNARLRASAINPVGGTVHWALLRSPFYLAVAHMGSVAMVELKLFLQHADKPPSEGSLRVQPTASAAQSTLSLAQTEAMASTIDELTRPPPVAKMRPPTAAVASLSSSTATATAAAIVRRASRPQTPVSAAQDHCLADREGRHKPAAGATDAVKTGRAPLGAPGASTSQRLTLSDLVTERPAGVGDDGDVSALISSDSDNDEDVLTPTFRAAPSRSQPPPPPSAPSFAVGNRRMASAASSACSSSRPTSPAFSSVSSRSSSSSSSSGSSSTCRPRAPPARSRSSAASERSFPIRRFVRDAQDGAPKRSHYYYSDGNNRPLSSSSTASSFSTSSSLSTSTALSADGLRRRISPSEAPLRVLKAQETTHAPATSPWVECFDAASRSVYYYNQVTGESRW